MQEEWYEPSRRDKLRSAAFASTPAGELAHQRNLDANMKCLHWRMTHEGFIPSPETLKIYEKWRAGHPELYTNPHK